MRQDSEESEYSSSYGEFDYDLDDELDFTPKSGQVVWVYVKDMATWYPGFVMNLRCKDIRDRHGRIQMAYPVKYRRNLRRHFSSMLGEMKPDTQEVRQLLAEAGVDVRMQLSEAGDELNDKLRRRGLWR
ncbi:hypothetical protein BD410DRAFT_256119 [Rickenella mellea]|uniref:PWWP domain-containing protein n=1 Tax=Rickenella mellea TaxID=50990 RepID=A0A4Y7Q3Q8_9AGAM|nr:hypothetical protein BD410DRAFT_256119 [Rickenella mellea]